MKFINTAIAALLFGSATLIARVGATDGAIRGLQGQSGNAGNGNNGNGNGSGKPTKFFKAKEKGIVDQYIVVFEDTVENQQVESLTDSLIAKAKYGKKLGRPFRSAIKGFAAKLNEADAIALSERADIKYVEQDAEVSINGVTWGLDRIDQTDLPLNGAYSSTADGTGVTAYIIDTGILTTHSEFGSRASWGINTSGDGQDEDCNGHGTHGMLYRYISVNQNESIFSLIVLRRNI